MCFPSYCLRQEQQQAETETSSYKDRLRLRKTKQNSPGNPSSTGRVVSLILDPHHTPKAPSPETYPSSPIIQIVKMEAGQADPRFDSSPEIMMTSALPRPLPNEDCRCRDCQPPRSVSPQVINQEDPQRYYHSPTWSFWTDRSPLSSGSPVRGQHDGPHYTQQEASPEPSTRSESVGSTTRGAPELDPAFMSYPQIYVTPRTAAHISFPVVDYSHNRWRADTPWPHFYMAVAPQAASIEDLKLTLAPKGSGTVLMARSYADGEQCPVEMFFDLTELRCETIQLEVQAEEGHDRTKPAEKRQEPRRGKEKQKPVPFGLEDRTDRLSEISNNTVRRHSPKKGKKAKKSGR